MIVCRILLLFAALLWWTGSAFAQGLYLRDFKHSVGTDGAERCCFFFSAPMRPDLFSLQGDLPRVVIDVPDVSEWQGAHEVKVDGKLTQRVRLFLHRETGRLRIVLDLDPALNYVVDPTLDPDRHELCLDIREDTPLPGDN